MTTDLCTSLLTRRLGPSADLLALNDEDLTCFLLARDRIAHLLQGENLADDDDDLHGLVHLWWDTLHRLHLVLLSSLDERGQSCQPRHEWFDRKAVGALRGLSAILTRRIAARTAYLSALPGEGLTDPALVRAAQARHDRVEQAAIRERVLLSEIQALYLEIMPPVDDEQ